MNGLNKSTSFLFLYLLIRNAIKNRLIFLFYFRYYCMIDLSDSNIFEIYYLFFKKLMSLTFQKDLIIGVGYMTVHVIYVCMALTIVLSNNIFHLFIGIILVFINILSIYLIRTCPLIILEKKYLNVSFVNSCFNVLWKKDKRKNPKKKSKHFSKYLNFQLDELTLEGLFLFYLAISIKMMICIFYTSYSVHS